MLPHTIHSSATLAGAEAYRPEVVASVDTNDVSVAAAAYRAAFGHGVPIEVLRLFAPRPGPLLVEIRQAIALGRAVPGWRALSRASELSASSLGSSGI